MTNKDKISLIIPIYNALPFVKKCLKSVIKNFDFYNGEVFLINDNSDNATTKYLSRFIKKYEYIKLINNTENLGYVNSCNKALSYVDGEFVVILNSDTEIPKTFCQKIRKCFNSDSKIGTASPIASNSSNYWLPMILSLELMNSSLDLSSPEYPEIFNAEGFCICIRKEFIDKYGLYDTVYSPGYCEEVDLSLRLYSKGLKNVLIDNLYVKHARSKSFSLKSQQLKSEHNIILYRRWGKYFTSIRIRGDIIKNIVKKSFSKFSVILFKMLYLHNFLNNGRFMTYLRFKNYINRTGQLKKRVLYTCICGEYDIAPILQKYVDKDTRYVCFTDNKSLIKRGKIGEWEVLPLKFNKLCDTKNARWHKTHPHILFPEYKESVWIDANIDILTPMLFDLINKTEKEILVPIHHKRNDIYDEIEAVRLDKKESENALVKVSELLGEINMPHEYGLNETNIIFRKHNNPEIIKLMEDWWQYIENYSKRDQLSFSLILWKNNITPESLSISNARIDCQNFKFYEHDYTCFSAKILKKIFPYTLDK